MAEPTPVRGSTTRARWLIALAIAVIAVIVIVIVIASRDAVSISRPSSSPSAENSTSPIASPSISAPGPSESGAPSDPAPSPTQAPAPIGSPSDVMPGVTAVVSSVEAVEGTAEGPGEVAGPAIKFVITVTNDSEEPISLATAVINVDYGVDRTPASELSRSGGSPFPAEVAAGASETGTFVYTIPRDQRADVRITVDYSVDVPPLVFAGAVPA